MSETVYSVANKVRMVLPVTVLNAEGSTGWGTAKKVVAMTNLVLEILGADTATATIKVFTSNQLEEPTWGGAVTASNRYAPVACLDLDVQSSGVIDGSTGLAVADGLKQYLVSTQGAMWINIQVESISSGNVTALLSQFNNQ